MQSRHLSKRYDATKPHTAFRFNCFAKAKRDPRLFYFRGDGVYKRGGEVSAQVRSPLEEKTPHSC